MRYKRTAKALTVVLAMTILTQNVMPAFAETQDETTPATVQETDELSSELNDDTPRFTLTSGEGGEKTPSEEDEDEAEQNKPEGENKDESEDESKQEPAESQDSSGEGSGSGQSGNESSGSENESSGTTTPSGDESSQPETSGQESQTTDESSETSSSQPTSDDSSEPTAPTQEEQTEPKPEDESHVSEPVETPEEEKKPEEESKEESEESKPEEESSKESEDSKKEEEEEEKKESVSAGNPSLFGELEMPEIITSKWYDAQSIRMFESTGLRMYKAGDKVYVNLARTEESAGKIVKMTLVNSAGQTVESGIKFTQNAAVLNMQEDWSHLELRIYMTADMTRTEYMANVDYRFADEEAIDDITFKAVTDAENEGTIVLKRKHQSKIPVLDDNMGYYVLDFSPVWTSNLAADDGADIEITGLQSDLVQIDTERKIVKIPYEALEENPNLFDELSAIVLVPVRVIDTMMPYTRHDVQITIDRTELGLASRTFTQRVVAPNSILVHALTPTQSQETDVELDVIINGVYKAEEDELSFNKKTGNLGVDAGDFAISSIEVIIHPIEEEDEAEPEEEKEEEPAKTPEAVLAALNQEMENALTGTVPETPEEETEKTEEEIEADKKARLADIWTAYCLKSAAENRYSDIDIMDLEDEENVDRLTDIFWEMNDITLYGNNGKVMNILTEKNASDIASELLVDDVLSEKLKAAAGKTDYAEIAALFKVREEVPLWPFAAEKRVTCLYNRPDALQGNPHRGTDIAAPEGTEILAIKSGKVVRSGWNDSYGYFVKLEHADGTKTLYAHMIKTNVEVDDVVKQGDVIGFVGSTGDSLGNHLHLEWVEGTKLYDPLDCVMPSAKIATDRAIAR